MTNILSGNRLSGRRVRIVRGRPDGRRPRTPSNAGWGALVFALPAILIFGLFSWFPIIRSIVMSFERTNFISSTWVGWGNFTYVLSDPLFGIALRNSLYFTVLAIVIGFPLPVFLAVVISEVRRRKGIYSYLVYLPVVIPPVVSIFLWRFLYQPDDSGAINSILSVFSVGPLAWLSSSTLAMPAMVVEWTWAGLGTSAIIYIAAMSQISAELYEAAELDGASIFGRIWHVTLPQLRPVLLVILLLQIIGSMQVFTEPFLFTGGGPENATISILLLIYRYAFANGDFGAAAAASVLLAVLLAIFSGLYAVATRKWGTR